MNSKLFSGHRVTGGTQLAQFQKKTMRTLLLLLFSTATANAQFGIGTTWGYATASPYASPYQDKVIGIAMIPTSHSSQPVRVSYTEHGRGFATIQGTLTVGHVTQEGFNPIASIGNKVPCTYQDRGKGQWRNMYGTIFSDNRTGGIALSPTIGVICTWAINGNTTDTTSTLTSVSLKGDATAKDEWGIIQLITADKEADEKRNDRTIYLGNIILAWGDVDKDGDNDAAALVGWEYGGSGYEQRLFVATNNGNGKFTQSLSERIALKGEDAQWGAWVTIDSDGIQAHRKDFSVLRWVMRRGKITKGKPLQ